LVLMSTVRGSTTSAPAKGPARLAQRAPGFSLKARSMVNLTAWALKGVPSWNLTLGRSVKRSLVGESTCQLVASRGWSLPCSSSTTSGSMML
jgi:hypothetical protein